MSLNFDHGVAEVVDVGDITAARFLEASAWTTWCFARFETFSDERCTITKDEGGSSYQQFIMQAETDGRLKFRFNSTTHSGGVGSIVANTWYMLAVTNDGLSRGDSVNGYAFNMDGSVLVSVLDVAHGGDASNLTADIRYGLRRGSTDEMDGDLAYGCYLPVELTQAQLSEAVHHPYRVAMRHAPVFFHPLVFVDPEPDWSGNGNTGSHVSSLTSADMPPIAPVIGFDLDFVPVDTGGGGAALVKIKTETEQISELARSLLALVRKRTETEQISEQARVQLDLVRKQTETEQIVEQARKLLAMVKTSTLTAEEITENTSAILGLTRVAALETEEISEAAYAFLRTLGIVLESENIVERVRKTLFVPLLPTSVDPIFTGLPTPVAPSYSDDHVPPVSSTFTVPPTIAVTPTPDVPEDSRFNTRFHLLNTGFEENEQGELFFRTLVGSTIANYTTFSSGIVGEIGLKAMKMTSFTFPYGPGGIPNITTSKVGTQFFRVADITPEILDPQVKFKVVYSFWWATGTASIGKFVDLRLDLFHPAQDILTPPSASKNIVTLGGPPPQRLTRVFGEYTLPDNFNGIAGDYQLVWQNTGSSSSGASIQVALDEIEIEIVPLQFIPTYAAGHGTPVEFV